MSIDHIWDNLTDEERADLDAYIDEAVEYEKLELEAQLRWDHESDVERSYEEGYDRGVQDTINDSIEKSIQDHWPLHNELGHVGSLEMCDQSPCNLF